MVARQSNHSIAQEDLKKLQQWENKWLLKFSVKYGKCKTLSIGKGNLPAQYLMDGINLPVTDEEKDLGVITTSTLRWDNHIRSCINKAKAVVGWISRNVISRDINVMINIYKSLVRPHLEYAVQVWNPPAVHGNWKIILELEGVQRSFTRMIDNIGLLTYKERLAKLGLTTLLERRARGDLIETYKIISKNVQYGESIFRLSRSGAKLVKDKRDQSFLPNRIADYWNKIPLTVKDAPTVDVFKARLEGYKNEYTRKSTTHGHFWELSDFIFNKIADSNRDSYESFMLKNPEIAKIKNINITR